MMNYSIIPAHEAQNYEYLKNMRKYKTTTAYLDETRLFYIALSSLVIVVFLYMYFVSSSILNVVMLKEVDEHFAEVQTVIGDLESTYIEVQHTMSSDIATHRGFVEAKEKIFIDRGEDTLVMVQN